MTARSFGRLLVASIVIELASGILRLAVPVALARAIGAQAYGLYATATNLTVLVFTLGTSGVPLAATYFTATYPGRSTTLRLLACSTALALAAALTTTPFAALYYQTALSEVPPWIFASVLAAAIPYGIELTSLGVLRGRTELELASSLGLARQVVLLCTATALPLLHGSLNEAILVFVATGTTLALLSTRFALSSAQQNECRPPTYKQIIKYAGHVQTSTVLTFLNYRLGLFALAAIVPATDLGIYAAASIVGEAIWFFSHFASSALAGQVATAPNAQAATQQTERACRMVTAASLLASLTLASISPLVMAAFGADFRQGWDVLVVCLLAACLLAPSRVLATHRAAMGSPQQNIRGTALGALTNIALIAVLTPSFGALGAAIANAIGYGVIAVDRVTSFVRPGSGKPSVRLRDLLIPNAADLRALVRSAGEAVGRLGRSGR